MVTCIKSLVQFGLIVAMCSPQSPLYRQLQILPVVTLHYKVPAKVHLLQSLRFANVQSKLAEMEKHLPFSQKKCMLLTSCHNIPSDFISSQKIPKQEKRKKKERKKTGNFQRMNF
jgi:hypothetical protein